MISDSTVETWQSGFFRRNEYMLINFKILENGSDLANIALLTKFVINFPQYRESFDEKVLPHLKQRRKFVGETPFQRLNLYSYLLKTEDLSYLVPKAPANHLLQCKLKGTPIIPYSGELM